jgi:hypothetical protein
MAAKNDLIAVIEDELDRHPRMSGRDLQKLLYQSVFGGDHLLEDPTRFRCALREEWGRLSVERFSPMGTVLQSIDPAGRVARIHLAVCRRTGVDVGWLAELLVGQRRKNGRRSDYEERWGKAIELAEAGRIPFSPGELARIEYPERAPHHSCDYGAAAYRIVNDATDPAMSAALRGLGVMR